MFRAWFLIAILGACVADSKPTLRTITAFVTLDSSRYEQQVLETASRLRESRDVFERAGFEVQTTRMTTQPFMEYVGTLDKDRALALFKRIEQLASQSGMRVNIGPAVLDDRPNRTALELLEELHSRGSELNSSMIIASEAGGIHWTTIKAAAHHVQRVAERSPHSQGTFSFAAVAMLAPGSPFFPGSYHLKNDGYFAIGMQTADVVAEVLARANGSPSRATSELTRALSAQASRVHEMAAEIERRTGWKYWGFDPTPTPLKDVSIGAAVETFYSARFGSSGTMTVARVITEAVRQIPGPRVGYAGLMLPVMEDARLAQRWTEGVINLDSLMAYSAVCGTGLDTVPLPGDVTEDQLARIMGDVATLAFKWNKPLTARLQPVHGKKAGEMTEFDSPYLVNVRLQPVRWCRPSVIRR